MAAPRERFDVVARGNGDPKAIPRMASELARLSGLATAQVASALRQGEFVVHRAFDRDDAERAADGLRTFGIGVTVRPAASAPNDLEIDLEIDRPEERARPISRRHSSLGMAPAASERPARSESRRMDTGSPNSSHGDPLLDPTRPQGRPAAAQSPAERPFLPVGTRRRKHETTRTRATDAVPPVSTAGAIELVTRLEEAFGAPTHDPDAVPEVVTLDARDSEAVEVRFADTEDVVAAASEGANDEDGFELSPARRRPPTLSVISPLSVETRGPTRDTSYGITPRATRRTPTAPLPMPERGRVTATPPAPSLVSTPMPGLDPPTPPLSPGRAPGRPRTVPPAHPSPSTGRSGAQRRVARRPLLGSDPVAATLFALAIGCALGFVVVQVAGVGRIDDEVQALEAELARARVHGPAASLRDAAAIEAELERLHRNARLRFLLVLFGTAVPLGLALPRIRV